MTDMHLANRPHTTQQEKALALLLARVSTVHTKLVEYAAQTKQVTQSTPSSRKHRLTAECNDTREQSAASKAVSRNSQASESRKDDVKQDMHSLSVLPYQQELIDVMLKLENSILFLPTGAIMSRTHA